MDKWEYTTVTYGVVRSLADYLQVLGRNGWELVSVIQNEPERYYVAFLKRKSSE